MNKGYVVKSPDHCVKCLKSRKKPYSFEYGLKKKSASTYFPGRLPAKYFRH